MALARRALCRCRGELGEHTVLVSVLSGKRPRAGLRGHALVLLLISRGSPRRGCSPSQEGGGRTPFPRPWLPARVTSPRGRLLPQVCRGPRSPAARRCLACRARPPQGPGHAAPCAPSCSRKLTRAPCPVPGLMLTSLLFGPAEAPQRHLGAPHPPGSRPARPLMSEAVHTRPRFADESPSGLLVTHDFLIVCFVTFFFKF